MNCIFSVISEEIAEGWLKERGPLYPEVFIRGRQTFSGFCTFNKGLSTMTISSTFHGHLTCIELLAVFKGLHQSCSSHELKINQGSLGPSLLPTGLWLPEASQSFDLFIYLKKKKKKEGHFITYLNVSSCLLQGS